MLSLALAAALTIQPTPENPRTFPLGIWYEGGVGAFRNNLIPEDPVQAGPLYRKNMLDIAAHGLDTVVAPNTTPEHFLPLLDAARNAGVRIILELGHEGGDIGAWIRGDGAISDEAVRKVLKEKFEPISGHPALARVQLLDEPQPPKFDRYGQIAAVLRGYAPSKQPFCCLIEADGIPAFLEKTGSDVAAFDCYPFGPNVPVGDLNALGHFESVARKAGLACAAKNADAWAVIQCHSITGGLRMPTAGELRNMAYCALGAGCRGIFWFLYQTEIPDKGSNVVMAGLVDNEYRERPLWKEAGLLSAQIRRLIPILSKLRPAEGEGVSGDASVFALKDASGQLYVMAVNRDSERERDATISIPAAGRSGLSAKRLPSGQSGPMKLEGDRASATLRLGPGDGALVRIDSK